MNNKVNYLMNNNVNYLETAKALAARINGDHPYEFVKALSLAAIANALIAIAEKVVSE